MWAVEVVDVIADHQLDQYGIEARDVDGLDGIVTAPFLHVGFAHLISNTIPFVIMGLLIAVEGARRLLWVFAIVGPRQRARAPGWWRRRGPSTWAPAGWSSGSPPT